MIEQLKTIRCIPLESCAKCPYSVGRQTCSKAQRDFEGGRPESPPDWCPLPALHPPAAQLEAMVGEQEPKFWYRPVGDDGLYEGPVHNNSVGGKMLRDEKPGEWVPLFEGAAPVAQQHVPEADCGNIKAQQPQAEPFQPDWVNYRQGLHDGWAEGYEQGIADERTSEASIGIAGFGAKVNPARENPYKTQPQQPQAEAVPAWTTEQITAVARPIAMAIAENCRTAPQLVFPHLFLGLKDLLTSTAPQQAEAVPPDVVLDAERYRWLFSSHTEAELAECDQKSLQPPHTKQDETLALLSGWYTTKEQADKAIDAAIAQQKGGV